MKTLKIYLLLLLIVFALIFYSKHCVLCGEIETYEGSLIKFDSISYSGGTIAIDSNLFAPKDSVKKILFAGRKDNSGAPEENKIEAIALSLKKAEFSEEIANMILKAEKLKEKYRGCGAVIILDEGIKTVRENGSTLYRYHFIGKIYNENYLDWSKLSLGYAEGQSSVKVILARSVGEDGIEYKMNPADMKPITASQESRYFDNMYKSVYGNIPGAKTGSIIEYIYESDHYNPFDTMIIHGGWYFQDVIPVVKSSFQISYPKNKKISFKFTGIDSGKIELIKKIDNSAETLTTEIYTLENVEPIIPEPYMPNMNDIKYGFHYSLLDGWEHLFNYYRKIQKERMIVTPEIKEIVDKIKKNAADDTGLMAEIFYWVENNIKYISVKSSTSSGWAGHPAEETLKKKFGDCTDVSILYSTMLNYAGIEAYPVIVQTNDAGELVSEIPVPDGNHCITEIRYGGKIFYIDPTSETYRFPFLRGDDIDIKAVNYIKGEIGRTQTPGPEDNMKSSDMEIILTSEGSAGCSIKNFYTGPYEAGLRNAWRHIKKEETRKVMQNYISNLCSLGIYEDFSISDLYDLTKQIAMEIKFKVRKIWEEAGSLRIIQTPGIEKSFDEITLKSRKYDILYGNLSAKNFNVKFILPQELNIKFLPEKIIVDNEYIFYSGSYVYNAKDNSIYFSEKLRVRKMRVPAEKYEFYKNELQKIVKFSKQRVFLTLK